MPRQKGLGASPEVGINIKSSLKVNNTIVTAIDDGINHQEHLSNSQPNPETQATDSSALNSSESEENCVANGPSTLYNDKYLHKKFKKMATVAPFNYVSTPSTTQLPRSQDVLLKIPSSREISTTPTTAFYSSSSPSPEFLQRHISKLISQNQAIIENDPLVWPKKYVQRTNKETISPSSPSLVQKEVPSSWNSKRKPPPSPLLASNNLSKSSNQMPIMNPFFIYPPSPLSSGSSSSSTEFSFSHQNNCRPKQTPDSKLALALRGPKYSEEMSSIRCPVEDDQSMQPLNLTVKGTSNQNRSPPLGRKRSYTNCFPSQEEALNCKVQRDQPTKNSLAPSFVKPEVAYPLNPFTTSQSSIVMHPVESKASLQLYGRPNGLMNSPVKVSPPRPSPGPLLGKTPLVDSSFKVYDSKMKDSQATGALLMPKKYLGSPIQMYGGEVQIKDAQTVRTESAKITPDLLKEVYKARIYQEMPKSVSLQSGGTTTLQTLNKSSYVPISPYPISNKSSHLSSTQAAVSPGMLLIPVLTNKAQTVSPKRSSPPTTASLYNGEVLTIVHGGKAIPHVPGIPGPLSVQCNEPPLTPEDRDRKGNLLKTISNLDIRPIVKKEQNTVCENVPPSEQSPSSKKSVTSDSNSLPNAVVHPLTPHLLLTSSSSDDSEDKTTRFLRPTSLPLKPGTYTPKRHLNTPSANSLVSPETPRPRKGYGQLYLNGHAYTYLGLKCSTRLFFCTLNKPQPMYVPLSPEHNTISMYSNWKICSDDPNPFGLSATQMLGQYRSSSRSTAYTIAQSKGDLLMTHSSYYHKRNKQKSEENKDKDSDGGGVVKVKIEKTTPPAIIDHVQLKSEPSDVTPDSQSIPVGALVPEVVINEDEDKRPKRRKIFAGGFESYEDYIYIRGRGRGRFVCEECGIRCRKPSMLKKHIKTHSDVRLYTCTFCSFSFKTKGNLTKHMKSKAHFKKCVELGVSPVPPEDLSGDEKADSTSRHNSESQDPEPGDEESEDEENYSDEGDDYDDDEDDDDDYEDGEDYDSCSAEDDERVNSELEHDVAHSLLSLSQMSPQIEQAGLPISSVRPSTYPYSTPTTGLTNILTTVMTTTSSTNTSVVSSSSLITVSVPSAIAVSVLPAIGESGKAATSILPPTSPNSVKKKAEFFPPSNGPTPNYVSQLKDGRSMCGICNKIFTKPSQLRLHLNIHYFERPFRCESCAVSFRTKGHLQKHQRSSSHLNKVNMNSTFGTATTTNPRPFKCDDCKIAFRIHGHLAKHLRSKMHIMKLECVGKLPFGTYAELERCGYNLNDIDTTDCDNSLESLKTLAQKLYEKDPSKLGQWGPPDNMPPHTTNGLEFEDVSSDEGEMIVDQGGALNSGQQNKTEPSVHDEHNILNVNSKSTAVVL